MLTTQKSYSRNISFKYRFNVFLAAEMKFDDLAGIAELKQVTERVKASELKEDEIDKIAFDTEKKALDDLKTRYDGHKAGMQKELDDAKASTDEKVKATVPVKEEALRIFYRKYVEIQNQIEAICKQQIDDAHAYCEGKRKAIEQVKARVKTALVEGDEVMDYDIEGISDEAKDELLQRGKAAEKLTDDLISDDIESFLTLKDGNKVKFDDSEIERITQGLLFTMLEGVESGSGGDATDFATSLQKRGEISSDKTLIFDDHGVKIADVRAQMLSNMGFSMKDDDEKEEARNSRPSELFNTIASDDKIACELRGMLIGMLAKAKGSAGNSANLNAICDKVELIYNSAKAANYKGMGETEIESEWDEDALKNAGIAFKVLERTATRSMEFQAIASDYRSFLAQTGQAADKDSLVSKITTLENKAGVRTKKEIAELTADIAKAKQEHVNSRVTALHTKYDEKIAVYKTLHAADKFVVSPDAMAQLEDFKKIEKFDIAKFVSTSRNLDIQLDQALSSDVLKAAANQAKQLVDAIVNYSKRVAPFKTQIYNKFPQAKVETTYKSVTESDPLKVADALKPYPNWVADATTVATYSAQVNQEIVALSNRGPKETAVAATFEGATDRPEGYDDKALAKLPKDLNNKAILQGVKDNPSNYVRVMKGDKEYLATKDDKGKLTWFEKKSG